MSKKSKKQRAAKEKERKKLIQQVLREPTVDDLIKASVDRKKQKVNTKAFRTKQSFGPAE